jgi:hypothetical protein
MAKWIGKILVWLITVLLLIALPFIALIKGATWAYTTYTLPSFIALTAGLLAAVLVLFIYFAIVYGLFMGWNKLNWKTLRVKAITAFVIMVAYCCYNLFFFSEKQAKSPEVYQEFTRLHPLLRIGVGTIVLLDQSMVVTDLSRTKEDYKKMGLKTLKNSLHYPQADGYVHAMDLRTNGRHEWRNKLLQGYFWLMGFHTLRHVGTADHLHVSLSPHEHPQAI